MTEHHRDARFAQAITTLAVATRGELDDPTIELYDRALRDVPIDLLEHAAVELAKGSTFFPRPAEWRTMVDEILDRQQRARLASGERGQLALPGEVGAGDDWRCEDCANTGHVVYVDGKCGKGCKFETLSKRHTHSCESVFCIERRRRVLEARRRYGRKDA